MCKNLCMKNYYVYIITNFTNSTLYIGVTNNLERRLYEHKNKLVDGFSKRYNLNKLVYFEETTSIETAIEREKQLKSWKRDKKETLIKNINPTWKDLSEEWYKQILRLQCFASPSQDDTNGDCHSVMELSLCVIPKRRESRSEESKTVQHDDHYTHKTTIQLQRLTLVHHRKVSS